VAEHEGSSLRVNDWRGDIEACWELFPDVINHLESQRRFTPRGWRWERWAQLHHLTGDFNAVGPPEIHASSFNRLPQWPTTGRLATNAAVDARAVYATFMGAIQGRTSAVDRRASCQ